MPRHRARPSESPARGAATLVLVLLLLCGVALAAAYAQRGMLFEQRASANSYRAAQALAAAEAGIDWTLAQLNGGRIDTRCRPDATGPNDFRSRYLRVAADGSFELAQWPGDGGLRTPDPSCVLTDAGWECSCPLGPTTTLPGSADEAPAVFRVRLALLPGLGATHPGVLGATVRACNSALRGGRPDDVNDPQSCHQAPGRAAVEAQATVEIALGLLPALPAPPGAALTVGQSIRQAAGTLLRAANPDAASGLALHSGGPVDGAVDAAGPAGSSASAVVADDAALRALSQDPAAFFRTQFGMPVDTYREQPAVWRLACAPCHAKDVAAAAAAHPTRVLWLDGDLQLDGALTLGSAEFPVLLVVQGRLALGAPVTVHGVAYAGAGIDWQAGAQLALWRGALITAGAFEADANAHLQYDAGVVRRIQQGYGTFVRVPGAWHLQ